MNKVIPALCRELTDQLKKSNSPLVTLLQNGLNKKEVTKKLENINISLPDEVYELYKWKNGTRFLETNTNGERWLFPLGMFSSIEDSIDRYSYYAGKDGFWNVNMFLLFESNGGEMSLIDCDINSATYGMIYDHDLGAVDYRVIITIYDSLESLLKTVIECFKKGIFFYEDSRRTLQSHRTEEIEISKKFNPKSDFWKLYP